MRTTTSRDQDFLALLEKEAAYQSTLNQHALLPHQLDGLASFVGQHMWQVVLGLSAVSAGLIEIWRRW